MGVCNILIRWICCFLQNRQQFVRIQNQDSELVDIWGNVPQGTLLGIILFLVMINDLALLCPSIKFVDDTTTYELANSNIETNLIQKAADEALRWFNSNNMLLNESKTKEMIVNFQRNASEPLPIIINDVCIERVSSIKVLGVYVSNKLSWTDHVNYICTKSSKRIYNIVILKRSGVKTKDLVQINSSIIRPVLEYAAAVWHPGLTSEFSHQLELIQKRVLKIIYSNQIPYDEAVQISGLDYLHNRRETITMNYFRKIQCPEDKLHHMLNKNYCLKSLRTEIKYKLPICKTERFKNTFFPFVLYKQMKF